MVLIEHRPIEIVALLVAVLAGSLWTFRVFKGRRPLVRLPVQAGASLLVVASGLLLLLDGCVSLWEGKESSPPLYSPDRKHAVVMRDMDGGALGGSTYVDLYSYGGFFESVIGGGEWKHFEARNTRWISNHEIVLQYDTSYPLAPMCNSVPGVRVTCVPLP